MKSTAKVGAVVLLALGLGIYLYQALSHSTGDAYKVRLIVSDTQGLGAQSVVRMQGVAVGEVLSVDLDSNNQPIVWLAIKRRYRIPTSYRFKITSGILISAAQVQIVPAPRTDDTAKLQTGFLPQDDHAVGSSLPAPGSPLANLSPELANSLTTLNGTFGTITERFDEAYKKIDVVLSQTEKLMSTANRIASSTNSVISDPRIKTSLIGSLENIKATTDDAHMMSTQLRRDMDDLVGSSKGNLKDFGTKINSLLDHVDSTIQDTDTVVQKLTEQVTDPHLQQSLQETAELARATLARFNQIASDIHALTGDPDLQADLKHSVSNLKSATERGQQAIERVDKILGAVSSPDGKARFPKIPSVSLTANVSEQLNPTRMRVDLDATASLGKRSLLDFGLYDLGQNTRLNLQGGSRFSDVTDLRYGLYASKLGVGFDYTPHGGPSFRADLWDTERLRLDVRGLFRVNKNASFWIGSDNLLRTPIPMVGVQLNQ